MHCTRLTRRRRPRLRRVDATLGGTRRGLGRSFVHDRGRLQNSVDRPQRPIGRSASCTRRALSISFLRRRGAHGGQACASERAARSGACMLAAGGRCRAGRVRQAAGSAPCGHESGAHGRCKHSAGPRRSQRAEAASARSGRPPSCDAARCRPLPGASNLCSADREVNSAGFAPQGGAGTARVVGSGGSGQPAGSTRKARGLLGRRKRLCCQQEQPFRAVLRNSGLNSAEFRASRARGWVRRWAARFAGSVAHLSRSPNARERAAGARTPRNHDSRRVLRGSKLGALRTGVKRVRRSARAASHLRRARCGGKSGDTMAPPDS